MMIAIALEGAGPADMVGAVGGFAGGGGAGRKEPRGDRAGEVQAGCGEAGEVDERGLDEVAALARREEEEREGWVEKEGERGGGAWSSRERIDGQSSSARRPRRASLALAEARSAPRTTPKSAAAAHKARRPEASPAICSSLRCQIELS